MRHETNILAWALAALSGTLALAQVPGYNPYSWQPAMGYGINPGSLTIPSEGTFTQTAWVRDLDEYQRIADGAIVQLKNSATTIDASISSGTLMNTLVQYDDSTGTRTFTYTIKAHKVAPDTIAYFYDYYTARDVGSDLAVRDSNGTPMTVVVTVTGPKSPPGGGQ